MTRALIVQHDPAVAEEEVVSLSALGYEIERCSGPDRCGCPVVAGRPCLLAEHADILVYDLRSLRYEEHERDLAEQLRELYADKPLVVVVGDGELGTLAPVEMGEGVVRLHGPITAERLDLVLEDALGDR